MLDRLALAWSDSDRGVAILLPFTYGMEPVSMLMIWRLFWWRLRWFYHRNFVVPRTLPPQPPLLMVMTDETEKQGWHECRHVLFL